MAKRSSEWPAYDGPSFDFGGAKLGRSWDLLHRADLEAKPTGALAEVWRSFHEGDFESAWINGQALGSIGASAAIKAAGIHAARLQGDASTRLTRYREMADLAELACVERASDPNSHYRLAFALGRLGQELTIAKALKEGLAGRIKSALDRTFSLAPDHAEAHLAAALYHAEIVAKVGSMIAKLTYGARAEAALEHVERALALDSSAPIAHIEHGNVLLTLYGGKREDEAAAAYERAAALAPYDAMSALDVGYASAQLA